ncbi:MAG: Pyruvate ferredoxin oxidoreductase alpha subunit [Parcubacteria group bacterium GW2011_GWC2_39_14]|nr:MAG: Pyruvate ferredoxin oxidoreductase alpha subunit [Parcubacteria group bacterium GW2011_GWC2_39_14]KKR54746.1 MAG: Pyruvate ferredoxin oxidoreductase alpha subunit [Parcubacteria group bacterium GW2011_GWA2_40_23]
MKKCIEGSHAVAEIVKLCRPAVIAAYPITPQTHIVEDLAKFKADGEATYDFVRTESEFSAASIVLGASASGVRTYTASSSQGLLLMLEVLFTISGMRLPVVLTCANRAISAPINIWNDQQDAMTIRDSGWIMLYAENNQEALDMHLVAYKVAEKLSIPVMVNMDGFVLTHTFETIEMPELTQVKKYLPDYKPLKGQFLDVNNPRSLGAFATPEDYMPIREDLFKDLIASKAVLRQEFGQFKTMFGRGTRDLVEYYGDKKANVVFVAMGSVVGTIKDTVDELNKAGKKVAVVKLKTFRPFPTEEVIKKLSGAKFVAVIDKSISLGQEGIIAIEIKAVSHKNIKAKVQSFILGLGGRDITKDMIAGIYKKVQSSGNKVTFIK